MKSTYANHDVSGFHRMFKKLVLDLYVLTIYAQIQPPQSNLSIKSEPSIYNIVWEMSVVKKFSSRETSLSHIKITSIVNFKY